MSLAARNISLRVWLMWRSSSSAAGYKVAIVPQPNWRDDLRDFRKFGAPRLFFGISPGAMDSMVNHYTAARRKRSDDAYTPDGRAGMRPDYPTIVYSQILRRLFPDTPIVAGGIEASLRRLSHYDYWQDRLRPGILAECDADILSYGMGEHTIAGHIGFTFMALLPVACHMASPPSIALLCCSIWRKLAAWLLGCRRHSSYEASKGKFIASRSKESIMQEVKQVAAMPDFKGYISDLGGPSANMYAMGGRDKDICAKCRRPSCLHPKVCPNLDTDHSALLNVYHCADAVPGVRKSFVGSGVRYDLAMHPTGDRTVDSTNRRYCRELIADHVSGRLKVAPEHTSDAVLDIMRKPSFALFHDFKRLFDNVNHSHGLKQQLIPYFISSHPGCRETDMAMLAAETKELNFHLEQVQDFTPTPMTVATEIYYTGYHPYTLEKVYTARSSQEKLAQRRYFFWYDRTYRLGRHRRLFR